MSSTKKTLTIGHLDIAVRVIDALQPGRKIVGVSVMTEDTRGGNEAPMLMGSTELRELADAMDALKQEEQSHFAPRELFEGARVMIEGRRNSFVGRVAKLTPAGKARIVTTANPKGDLFTYDAHFAGQGAWVGPRKNGPMNMQYRERLIVEA